MLTTNEIVKEQMLQTTSKKIVKSSEKKKPRAYHIHSTSGLKVLSGLRLAFSGSPKGACVGRIIHPASGLKILPGYDFLK